MSTDLFGMFALVILVATLFVRSTDRWRDYRSGSRSGTPLLAEALTGLVFLVYSLQVSATVFTVGSGLILAASFGDFLMLRRARRRAARRAVVMLLPPLRHA